MRLISLEAENFLKFERLALEFPDGLTGIVGPNGSGKSSLVEGIAWALYGSSVSRTRNEGIPFRRNVPCRVVLVFEVEGDEYRVVRELRGASCSAHAEVFVNGLPVEVGTERTNRLLVSRLRMDHRAFMVSFFAKQKELDALTNWEPRDRKRYILRMLGLERVERSIEMLRRDVADAERDLIARQQALPPLEAVQQACRAARQKVAELTRVAEAAHSELESADKEFRAARQQLDSLEAQQRTYSELVRKRDLARQALENARREARMLDERVRTLREQEDSLRCLEPKLRPLDDLRARVRQFEVAAHLVQAREGHRRTVAECQRRLDALAADIKRLEQQVAQGADLQAARKQTEADLARAREELADVQGAVRSNENRLKEIGREVALLNGDLQSFRDLGRQGKCPTCRRTLNGSYTAVVEHLEAELARLRQEQAEYTQFVQEDRARVAHLQRSIGEAEAERRRLDAALEQVAQARATLVAKRAEQQRTAHDLERAQAELDRMKVMEYDAAAHRQAAADVAELERIEQRVIGLRHAVQRLPEEERAAQDAREAIPQREQDLAAAEQQLCALGFDPDAYAAHRERCRALEQQREQAYARYHKVSLERERALMEQQQADARKEDYDRQVEEIAFRRADKENLDELLNLMQSFRVHLIGRIRPALAQRTSLLVRDLTDGKYDQVELDEDYELSMYDDGERRELRAFSGGENDLVHLCLRLAIADMIYDASGGAEHGFLVLDEVLASQDGERRHLILQALARLSRRFRQILMITHLDDMKEMVEHVVELHETPGGSSVIVAA